MIAPNCRHTLALILVAGLAGVPAVLVAQPQEAGAGPQEAGAGPREAGAGPQEAGAGPREAGAQPDKASGKQESAQDFRDIDAILAQDEEALYTQGASLYDPGGRRDPFRSLLERSEAESSAELRPEGIPGLLIDDLKLEGVFITPAGPVAQVQAASDQVSYLLRPGDQLWDGDVVNVTVNEIVFKQSVDDPTALKPFREVAMRLYEP